MIATQPIGIAVEGSKFMIAKETNRPESEFVTVPCNPIHAPPRLMGIHARGSSVHPVSGLDQSFRLSTATRLSVHHSGDSKEVLHSLDISEGEHGPTGN